MSTADERGRPTGSADAGRHWPADVAWRIQHSLRAFWLEDRDATPADAHELLDTYGHAIFEAELRRRVAAMDASRFNELESALTAGNDVAADRVCLMAFLGVEVSDA